MKHRFLTTSTREAIGIPSANATAVLSPVEIAKAVPSILPEIISGGIDAPIENDPTKANSKVAPIIIPICTSPMISPASVHVTSGLDSIDEPNKYSPFANIAASASKIAVPNCSIIYPFFRLLCFKGYFFLVRHLLHKYIYIFFLKFF
ncbi:hypothetical protein AF825_01790 [Listeria monocytogenes]|nr:hypothetical protein AF825_01790 [Listeria monocytogenes]